MLKRLIILFLIILCLIPISSAADVAPCPTCPVPTPYIVYVTVTVTVPVPQTLPPTPAPTPTSPVLQLPPAPTPDQNVITKFTGLSEYIIYGLLFVLLIGGIIFMKFKQNRKNKLPVKTPVIEAPKNKYDYLYEEDTEPPEPKPIIKEIPQEKPKKPKKPKKPVSLLDKDFEF
jgi:hypothetical protein